MNGYIAFFKGKQIEVYADTQLAARTLAAKQFKAKRDYDVTVMLAERGATPDKSGVQVVHAATF